MLGLFNAIYDIGRMVQVKYHRPDIRPRAQYISRQSMYNRSSRNAPLTQAVAYSGRPLHTIFRGVYACSRSRHLYQVNPQLCHTLSNALTKRKTGRSRDKCKVPCLVTALALGLGRVSTITTCFMLGLDCNTSRILGQWV